ncbi:hypothetical protein LUZ61_009012 [Rhynchospora tenuis]|uniref:Uncharacterized protein n=1 Tax=Rhynchospora tenuis TaxID=198213 RepID=A0AAD5ZWK9_9POAL|nr:hypothetical protein LUZ61_009012 [Rhynchospora tenuis]
MIEKSAFAIVSAARKLRPYFQAHSIRVVTNMPLRKALGQFNVAERLLKWAIELSEFDIIYLCRTAYKSQVLADFIIQGTSVSFTPVEVVWEVYVDGASSSKGTGLGVEIISPQGDRFKYALQVNFNPSHNIAEYEAFIAELQLVAATSAKSIRIRSDSQLVVNQILKEYKTQDETLIKYLKKVEQLMGGFDSVLIEHSLEFTIIEDELCKKGYHHPWLTCVGKAKAAELLNETHQGICGSHQGPGTLGKRIMRQGKREPQFIVVAVEYFIKWIKVKALSLITFQMITDFLEHHIVYRYGIPHTIITDNGKQFTGAPFKDYCRGLGIEINFASVCHPQSNELAEVSNRTILEGLKKKIEGTKNTWPEYLSEVV